MMDTILNLGMNDEVVEGFARRPTILVSHTTLSFLSKCIRRCYGIDNTLKAD